MTMDLAGKEYIPLRETLMTRLTIIALFCSIDCYAQLPAKPAHSGPAPNHLSDSFSKLSLRALLAIKSEDFNNHQAVSATELLINDANVEAKSKIELSVIADLQTIQALNAVNSTIRGLRLRALEAAASLRAAQTGKVEDSVDAYNTDPFVISSSKQDQTCQDALELSLRNRTYSKLPSICSKSD